MRAIEWISLEIMGGEELERCTLESVSDFVLYWAIFEGSEIDRQDTVGAIRHFACRIAGTIDLGELETAREYWRQRYVSGDRVNDTFGGLQFSCEGHKVIAAKPLLEGTSDGFEVVHGLLMIVYRLRNNLFHGEKDVTRLDEQRENLFHGGEVLRVVMRASGRYVFYRA